MTGTKLPKLVAATALAIAALAATPLAEAGAGIPQKHPDAEKRPHIIAVLKHSEIIAVLKRPDIIAVLKHAEILGVRKSSRCSEAATSAKAGCNRPSRQRGARSALRWRPDEPTRRAQRPEGRSRPRPRLPAVLREPRGPDLRRGRARRPRAWSCAQFVGAFGLIEVASGPREHRLAQHLAAPDRPAAGERAAEREARRFDVVLPHWGGLARCGAGVVCLAIAGWQVGLDRTRAARARARLVDRRDLRPVRTRGGRAAELDVVQFVVRWRRRENELAPISISTAVLQSRPQRMTLPGGEAAPALGALPARARPVTQRVARRASSCRSSCSCVVALLWAGRIELHAPPKSRGTGGRAAHVKLSVPGRVARGASCTRPG